MGTKSHINQRGRF